MGSSKDFSGQIQLKMREDMLAWQSELQAGGLAQLGERRVRNAEVEGSNPLPSTRRTA